VTGTESRPAVRAAKSTTPEKDVAGDHATSPASAQPDKLAGLPTDTPAQPGPAAPGADQAAPAAPQPLAVTATADPSAANAASAPAAQTAAAIAAVPVAGVAVEIAARAQTGTNRFSIRLDPPELGRIDVRLDVDKQGNVTSHLVVERSATLDMLRRDAPQLQRALQDAGLKTNGDGLQFSLRDQGAGAQNQNQSFQDNSSARSARVIIPTDDVTPVDTARNYGRLYGQSGGLDIRV
jgi:flagellar hook-length control protein FliK